jgi:hypothetical protein
MHVAAEWDLKSQKFRAAVLANDLSAVEALREAIISAFDSLRHLFELPDDAELEWDIVMIDDYADAIREWMRQVEAR